MTKRSQQRQMPAYGGSDYGYGYDSALNEVPSSSYGPVTRVYKCAGPYAPQFNGNWYCCQCPTGSSIVRNANGANSIDCEDATCRHRRCSGCKNA